MSALVILSVAKDLQFHHEDNEGAEDCTHRMERQPRFPFVVLCSALFVSKEKVVIPAFAGMTD